MEQWSSKLGFLLAAVGAAVGLGNIWRFPAVVGQNGGGAYLIPYFIAAFVFAVPMLILEISVGRSYRADVVSAFRRVRPQFGVIGWVIVASVLIVLSYYLVITGWVLGVLSYTAVGADLSFQAFTDSFQPIAFFLVSTLLVGAIVSLGVTDGIERMSTILMPLVFVVLLGLTAYAATLSGFGEGLRFFLTPDFGVLTDPLLWGAAFGQVFFSFSVGQGIMLTYGSYLDDTQNIPRTAVQIAVVDLTAALLAGVAIFGITFSFGIEPTIGTQLAFVSLPTAFDAMAFGSIVAVAFFSLLFIAAITSSVSMLEVGVAAIAETTGWSRRRTAIVTTGTVLVAGLPSALSYSALELTVGGVAFLDVLDGSVGTFGLPIAAITIAVTFMWFQSATMPQTPVSGIVSPIVKYAVPVVLSIIVVLRLLSGETLRVWLRLPDHPVLGIGPSLLVLLAVVPIAIGLRYAARQLR